MKLGDVMKLSRGNLISIDDDIEYTIAGVQNYGAGILNRRKVKGFELNMRKYQLIKPNQLMWCKVDTKNGAFGITKSEHSNSLASTNMALADIDLAKCHPEFIEYLFRISFFHEIITKASSGTTNRKYLTPSQLFEDIEIPDFNKDEQLNWLEKVDLIINSGITTELINQLSLVKKLRQQLLQDAVQGKLVKQNTPDEPASELLKKIKAEKEQLIKAGKLKKEKELPAIKEDEIPFEIPESWVWCRLGEITKVKVGSTPSRDNPKFWNGDIPWVSSGAVANNYIYDTKERITKLGFENTSLIVYPKGSVLVAMIGQGKTRGQTSILKIDATTNQNVAGLIIEHDYLLSEYLWYFFLSRYEVTREGASGGNQPALNGVKISNTVFPLPPLPEQNRIVQKLDGLLQHCNELEASIKESAVQNEKLLQQVLREALRKEPVEV